MSSPCIVANASDRSPGVLVASRTIGVPPCRATAAAYSALRRSERSGSAWRAGTATVTTIRGAGAGTSDIGATIAPRQRTGQSIGASLASGSAVASGDGVGGPGGRFSGSTTVFGIRSSIQPTTR